MDINKALTFPTEDERWITKLAIGALLFILSFLIIPIFFIYGYMIQLMRNVMAGIEKPLPEWGDWGKLFMDGLNMFIAGLVYTLPISLALCCSLAFFLPSANMEGDAAEIMAGIGVLAMVGMSCIVFIFALALMVIGPAIAIQYAREGTLGACFRFSEVIGIARDNIGDIVIALVVVFAISFVLSLVSIIPIIGWIILLAANMYVIFITGHMYGQIGAKTGGGPAPKEKEFDPVM